MVTPKIGDKVICIYGVGKDGKLLSSPYISTFVDEGCIEITMDEFNRMILGQNDDMFPIY